MGHFGCILSIDLAENYISLFGGGGGGSFVEEVRVA